MLTVRRARRPTWLRRLADWLGARVVAVANGEGRGS
jgi:hypothetical protein